MEPTAGVSGAGHPVQIFLQAPTAQYAGQTSRLTVVPILADSHGPTPPAQVTNNDGYYCMQAFIVAPFSQVAHGGKSLLILR